MRRENRINAEFSRKYSKKYSYNHRNIYQEQRTPENYFWQTGFLVMDKKKIYQLENL